MFNKIFLLDAQSVFLNFMKYTKLLIRLIKDYSVLLDLFKPLALW